MHRDNSPPYLSHNLYNPHACRSRSCSVAEPIPAWAESAFSGTWLLTWSVCGCWCSDVDRCDCGDAPTAYPAHPIPSIPPHPFIHAHRGTPTPALTTGRGWGQGAAVGHALHFESRTHRGRVTQHLLFSRLCFARDVKADRLDTQRISVPDGL